MRPTVPELIPLVRKLYAEHSAGGYLHIVLDDGNVGDEDVEYCIQRAEEDGVTEQAALGRLILQMTRMQRIKLYNAWWRQ